MSEQELQCDRRSGTNADSGIKFEFDVTALAYLRCENLLEDRKQNVNSRVISFIVVNNLDHVGNFDDVVVKVEFVDGDEIKSKLIFVQCKHAENPTAGSEKNYSKYLSDGMLKKYFDSFVKILHIFNDEKYISNVRFEEIETSFIGESLEKLVKDKKMNAKDLQENIKSNIETNRNRREKIRNVFHSLFSDCEFLLYSNVIVTCSKSHNVSRDIACQIFNTNENLCFEKKVCSKNLSKLKFGTFRDDELLLLQEEFRKKFRIFVNQNVDVSTEIKQIMKSNVDEEIVALLLKLEIENIFRNTTYTPITEKSELLRNVECFCKLKIKSTNKQEEFISTYGSQSLFSVAAVQSLHDVMKTVRYRKIDTPYPILENVRVMQLYMKFLNEKSMFVFLEEEVDLNTWMCARKTNLYRNLKSVLICSEIPIKKSIDRIEGNEMIFEIKRCSENQMNGLNSLEFSEETEKLILNTKVGFQGSTVSVGDICGDKWRDCFDENSICNILQQREMKIDNVPLPSLDFYLQRKLNFVTTKSHRVKQLRQNLPNIERRKRFQVFSEKEKEIPGYNEAENWFENINQARRYIWEMSPIKDDIIHFCVRCGTCDDELEILYSFGEESEHTEIRIGNEEDVLHDKRNVSILTGLAGIGKSTTLNYLALKYKKDNPSHWVYLIELNKHLGSLNEFEDVDDMSSVVHFVATELLQLQEPDLGLFVNSCIENGNVALFFDAFDEISPDTEKVFPPLLLTLENTKIAHIFVSSRPSYVRFLEDILLCHAINFESFDTNEREKFLLHYWEKLSNKNSAIRKAATADVSRIDVVNKILHSIEFKDELDNLLAIPLQMRMLAEIYFENFNSMPTGKNEADIFKWDIFNMYENFINIHAKRYFIEKLGINWKNMKQSYKTKAINDILEDTEKFSFNFVFAQLETLNDDENKSVILKLRDQLGLITNADPPVFLHRTFAEFLAAKYIVKQMCNSKYDSNNALTLSNYETVYLDVSYSVVRKFVNAILHYKLKKDNSREWMKPALKINNYGENGNSAKHIAALEGNTEILKVLLWNDSNNLNEKNLYEETPLHAACKGNKTETIEFLIECDCLINVENLKTKSPIHYASKNGNLVIVKLFIQRDVTLLNKQDKYCRTPLLLASENNKTEVAKYLLGHDECRINIKDVHQRSPLHYASAHGNIELQQLLLNRDPALLNEQDCDGQTPLHHAFEKNKSEAAIFLIENHNCAINISNELKCFPIHCAAKNGDIDCINRILNRDHTQLNVMERCEQTPLFIACIANKTESVRCLLSKSNCTVKIDDEINICILTFAVRDENIEIIQLLLERDPTLLHQALKINYSPLHVACSLGKTESTKRLLAYTESFEHIEDVLAKSQINKLSRKSRIILKIFRILLDEQCNKDLKELQHLFVKSEPEALNYLLKFTDKCSKIDVRKMIQFQTLQFATILDYTEIIHLTLKQDLTLLNHKDEFSHTPLHLACLDDKADAAKCFLTYPSCEINKPDEMGNYQLHYASENGNVEIIQQILERDKELLNKQNCAGHSPLHLACKNNKTQAAKHFLTYSDCQLDIKNKEYRNTPLHFAAMNGNIEIIMLILERDFMQINNTNSSEESPLLCACKNNKVEAAKYILTYSNCEVNIKDVCENTALSFASSYGNTKLMKIILDRGRTLLNKQNNKGETPLHLASQNDKTEAVKFLLNDDDCSVDIEDKNKIIPLHHASRNGNIDVIKLFMKRQNTIINKTNDMGQSALHLACMKDKTPVVKYLLTNADCVLDLEDNNLNYPIHYAALNGNLEVMKLALDRDHSLLNKRNGKGKTPLHFACKGGFYEAVKFLISYSDCIKYPVDDEGNTVFHLAAMGNNDGKNIPVMCFFLNQDPLLLNLTNKINRTALHYAATFADNSGIKFLLKYKDIKMNVQDINGDTPLHVYHPRGILLTRYTKNIVELMVTHDSTVLNMKNKNGHPPIHTAALKNQRQIYQALVKLGADICYPAIPDVPWNSYKGFLRLQKILEETGNE